MTDSEWARLEEVLDAFAAAWMKGVASPDLTQLLPAPGDRLRLLYLGELIKSELEFRWRRKQRALVEDYLRRFPELKEQPSLVVSLILEEYKVRHRHGDRPTPSGYRIRFPGHFAEFQRLLAEQMPPPTTPPPTPTSQPAPTIAAPESTVRPQALTPADGILSMVGGYKPIRRLGSGQFGEVWLAEAPGGVEVALKIIKRGLEHADTQRELQALSVIKGLRHAYLLQLHGFWSLEDRLIIAMELADGSLRDEAKKYPTRCIPPRDLIRYMKECCEALDYLHSQRVLHRDIKPDNILLVQRHVKLADLGLARLLEEQKSFADTMCGTPAYMAPEIFLREGGRPQSDQYSLALTYVELRLNRMAFKAKNYMELMLAQAHDPPDLTGLAPGEHEVVARALAKDPAQRFPNCNQFYRALKDTVYPSGIVRLSEPPFPDEGTDASDLDWDKSVGGGPAPPPPVSAPPPRPTRRPPRRRAVALIGIGALFVGLLSAMALFVAPLLNRRAAPPTSAPLGTGRSAPVSEALQPGWAPAPGAVKVPVDGKEHWGRVLYVGEGPGRLPEGLAVPFALVGRTNNPRSPEPFYVMQYKVTNELFRAVADVHRERWRPENDDWKLGAISVTDGSDRKAEGDQLKFPVFRVGFDTAQGFARLLGGDLPTLLQWDTAAGFYNTHSTDDRGPFEGTGEGWELGDFALKLTRGAQFLGGACPVGTARLDRKRVPGNSDPEAVCYDLASNGFEWTLPPNPPGNEVILRGQDYTSLYPLTYVDFTDPVLPKAVRRARDPKLPFISFRVAVPLTQVEKP